MSAPLKPGEVRHEFPGATCLGCRAQWGGVIVAADSPVRDPLQPGFEIACPKCGALHVVQRDGVVLKGASE